MKYVSKKNEIVGTKQRISTIAPEIIDDLQVGDPILLDDGLFELKVVERGEDEVRCEVIIGGLLKSSKGMNLPRTSLFSSKCYRKRLARSRLGTGPLH